MNEWEEAKTHRLSVASYEHGHYGGRHQALGELRLANHRGAPRPSRLAHTIPPTNRSRSRSHATHALGSPAMTRPIRRHTTPERNKPMPTTEPTPLEDRFWFFAQGGMSRAWYQISLAKLKDPNSIDPECWIIELCPDGTWAERQVADIRDEADEPDQP